jgi:hypothetical protein
MVDLRKHGPKWLWKDQTKDIPYSVGTRLTGPNKILKSLGSIQFGFDRMETPPADRKHPESTQPNGGRCNTGFLSAVPDGLDSLTEIKDLLHIATKP